MLKVTRGYFKLPKGMYTGKQTDFEVNSQVKIKVSASPGIKKRPESIIKISGHAGPIRGKNIFEDTRCPLIAAGAKGYAKVNAQFNKTMGAILRRKG
jgi:hypothetical protein